MNFGQPVAAAEQSELRPDSVGGRSPHPAVRPALRLLTSGDYGDQTDTCFRPPALAAVQASFAADNPLAAEPDWFDQPMRWAQLNSTEDDAAEMDIPFWMDYFKRIHADALCITAGGVVAFYPTKIQYHRPSRWLSQASGLSPPGHPRLPEARHGRGRPHRPSRHIRGRLPRPSGLDRCGCRRPQAPPLGNAGHVGHVRAGPVQFRVHDGGHQGDRRRLSPRWAAFSAIAGKAPACATASTASGISGTTAAWTCRAPTTSTIPRGATISSGAKSACSSYGGSGMARSARSIPPRVTSPTPAAPMAASICETVGELAPTLFADRQGRSGVMAPWANGKNGKEYRSTLGRKPIGGIFHMGVVDTAPLAGFGPERQRDAHLGAGRRRQRAAALVQQSRRQRARPSLVEDGGGPVRLALEERAIPAQRGAGGARGAGLLAADHHVVRRSAGTPEGRGLLARHVPRVDRSAHAVRDAARPHARARPAVSSSCCCPTSPRSRTSSASKSAAFVENGGSVLATYETSLYDEKGERRPDFGLADLFGVSWRKTLDGPIPNSYLRVEESARRHPLMKGLEDARTADQRYLPVGSASRPRGSSRRC